MGEANKMKNYKLNTYANGFGIWHAEIVFTPAVGNTGEAQQIIANAIANAKRHIRQAITERMDPKKCKRLSYEISANSSYGTGHLASLTIREK